MQTSEWLTRLPINILKKKIIIIKQEKNRRCRKNYVYKSVHAHARMRERESILKTDLNDRTSPNENILGFHIPMDNTVRMQVMQCSYLKWFRSIVTFILNKLLAPKKENEKSKCKHISIKQNKNSPNKGGKKEISAKNTNCLAIACTCSSGKLLSSSRISKSSPYKSNKCEVL